MVQRIFNLIRKQYGSIHEAAILLGFFSLTSQLLGLIRDRALVSHIGPSVTLDVYYAAFRIPDFVYTALASLVAVTAIIPFLIEKLEGDGGVNAARELMDRVFTAFLATMCIVCFLLILAMPLIADVVAPGFSPQAKQLLVNMSRIMLLSPIFLGLQSLLGSVAQMHKKFFAYALAPVMYNTGILFGVLVLYPLLGVYGLAYGVVIGAMMHLGIQLPTVAELGFLPRFTAKINFRELWDIVQVALPRTLTLAMNTILDLVLTAIASGLTTGSISMLTFALNLQTVPIQMISVSYAVAVFPSLVESFASKKYEVFQKTIRSASQQIIFWSLPITALFIVLRAHVVRVVYGTHAMSWNDTRITAALFAVFSVGIVAQSLGLIFIRAYYASGKTAKPFLLTLVGAFVTWLCALILTHHGTDTATAYVARTTLRLTGVSNISVIGLGIAYDIGQFVTLALFWIFFKIDFGGHMLRTLWKTIWTSCLAALTIGFTAYGTLTALSTILSNNTFVGVFLEAAISTIVGTACAFLVLYFCGSEELAIFWNAIHSRFWKADVVMNGQEGVK